MEPIAEMEDDDEAFDTFDSDAPTTETGGADPIGSSAASAATIAARLRKLRNSPLVDDPDDSAGSTLFRSRSNTWPQFNYEDSLPNPEDGVALDESDLAAAGVQVHSSVIAPDDGPSGGVDLNFFESPYHDLHHSTSHVDQTGQSHQSHYHSQSSNISQAQHGFHHTYNTFYPPTKDGVELDESTATSGQGLASGDNGSSNVLSSLVNGVDDPMDVSATPNSAGNVLCADSLATATPTSATAPNSKKNSSRRNAWGNMSYADLITQAINGAPEQRLTLSQIYEWMVKNINYFKDKGDSNSSAGWKNSIRHNLSLHNRFIRVQNEGTGKSSWWMINPDAKPGKAARRRAISMETQHYEKRRGRVKRHVERLRAAAALGINEADAGYMTPSSTGSALSLVGRGSGLGSLHSGSTASLLLSSPSTAGPSSCYSKLGDSTSSLLLSPNTSLSNLCINDTLPLNGPMSRGRYLTPTSPEPYDQFGEPAASLIGMTHHPSGPFPHGFGSMSAEAFRPRTGSNASSSNSGSAAGAGSDHHQITPQSGGWPSGGWPPTPSSAPATVASGVPMFYSHTANNAHNETEIGDGSKVGHIAVPPNGASDLLAQQQQSSQQSQTQQHNKQSPVADPSSGHTGSDLYPNGQTGVSPTPCGGDQSSSQSQQSSGATTIASRRVSPVGVHVKMHRHAREINNNHQQTPIPNSVSGPVPLYESGYGYGIYPSSHEIGGRPSKSHPYSGFGGLDHMQMAKMSLGSNDIRRQASHEMYGPSVPQHHHAQHEATAPIHESYFSYMNSYSMQLPHGHPHGSPAPSGQHESMYQAMEYHHSYGAGQTHHPMGQATHSQHHHHHAAQQQQQQHQSTHAGEHPHHGPPQPPQQASHHGQGIAEFDFDAVCPAESMMMLECDVNQVIEHELSANDGALDFDQHQHPHQQHSSQQHQQQSSSAVNRQASGHQSTSPVQRELSGESGHSPEFSPMIVRSDSNASRSSQGSQKQQHTQSQSSPQTNALLSTVSSGSPTPNISNATISSNASHGGGSPSPLSPHVSNSLNTSTSVSNVKNTTNNCVSHSSQLTALQQHRQSQQSTPTITTLQSSSSARLSPRVQGSQHLFGMQPHTDHNNPHSQQLTLQQQLPPVTSQSGYNLNYDSSGVNQLHHHVYANHHHHTHHSSAESDSQASSPSVAVGPIAPRSWVH